MENNNKKTIYFRVHIGYGKDEYISVSETELERVYHLFYTQQKGVFASGEIVCGQNIQRITIDYNRIFNYYPNYDFMNDTRSLSEAERLGIPKRGRDIMRQSSSQVKQTFSSGDISRIVSPSAPPAMPIGEKEDDDVS